MCVLCVYVCREETGRRFFGADPSERKPKLMSFYDLFLDINVGIRDGESGSCEGRIKTKNFFSSNGEKKGLTGFVFFFHFRDLFRLTRLEVTVVVPKPLPYRNREILSTLCLSDWNDNRKRSKIRISNSNEQTDGRVFLYLYDLTGGSSSGRFPFYFSHLSRIAVRTERWVKWSFPNRDLFSKQCHRAERCRDP